jgi:hypothetical protein
MCSHVVSTVCSCNICMKDFHDLFYFIEFLPNRTDFKYGRLCACQFWSGGLFM